MPRRAINWLVLGFAALWFNVVLPVHKRGQLTLGGAGAGASASAATAKAAHACCKPAAIAGPADAEPHCPEPAQSGGGTCAVCFFMAGLFTPPPVTVVERSFERTGRHVVAPRAAPDDARFALPLHSRAPPLA
jgi:hypothetical protein